MEKVMSGDEKSIRADKAYANKKYKKAARATGIFYAVLDKAARGRKLSGTQKKRNKKISGTRAGVKHVFGFMNKKLKVTVAGAKTKSRKVLRFDMQCVIYDVCRASFLLKRKTA
jgi:IS5 family transposase